MHLRLLARLGLAAFLVCSLAATCARAEDDDDKGKKEEPKFPQVGNDDIFGFTTASELGDTGDINFANENDGRVGKRNGSYGALNSKYEFSYNVSSDFWVAASGYLAWNHVSNVDGLPNKNTFDFDGMSFEIAHTVITRSETNPWGITASVEPRWGRIDAVSGLPSNSYGFEGKLFIDRVVVPDTVFWAANVIWGPQWAQDPMVPGNNLISSTDTVSTALSWKVSKGLFLAVEARYFAQFGRIVPDHLQGQSLYIGPALAWKISDKVTFNVTYQPQVWGRSSATPGLALDLDNFERANFRVKLEWQLN